MIVTDLFSAARPARGRDYLVCLYHSVCALKRTCVCKNSATVNYRRIKDETSTQTHRVHKHERERYFVDIMSLKIERRYERRTRLTVK